MEEASAGMVTAVAAVAVVLGVVQSILVLLLQWWRNLCWGSVGEESVEVVVPGRGAWEVEATGGSVTGDGAVTVVPGRTREVEIVPGGRAREVEASGGSVTGAGTAAERWVGDGVKVTSLAVGVPSPFPAFPPCRRTLTWLYGGVDGDLDVL